MFCVSSEKSQQRVHVRQAASLLSRRVGDVWWDPDRLDEDSRDYLCLLAGLFETVLRGADAVHFRVLMKLFMKVRGSSFAGTPSL